MKKLFIISLLLTIILSSCGDTRIKYPIYSLDTIEYVPDSLKKEQREWITETIRAASQNMTGGDYEDVDETIQQVEITSNRLFEVSALGLRKQINDNYWDDLYIMPVEFNKSEKQIFDSLSVN